jgi:hypothetical protein
MNEAEASKLDEREGDGDTMRLDDADTQADAVALVLDDARIERECERVTLVVDDAAIVAEGDNDGVRDKDEVLVTVQSTLAVCTEDSVSNELSVTSGEADTAALRVDVIDDDADIVMVAENESKDCVDSADADTVVRALPVFAQLAVLEPLPDMETRADWEVCPVVVGEAEAEVEFNRDALCAWDRRASAVLDTTDENDGEKEAVSDAERVPRREELTDIETVDDEEAQNEAKAVIVKKPDGVMSIDIFGLAVAVCEELTVSADENVKGGEAEEKGEDVVTPDAVTEGVSADAVGEPEAEKAPVIDRAPEADTRLVGDTDCKAVCEMEAIDDEVEFDVLVARLELELEEVTLADGEEVEEKQEVIDAGPWVPVAVRSAEAVEEITVVALDLRLHEGTEDDEAVAQYNKDCE